MNSNAPLAAFGRLLIACLFIIGGIGSLAESDATKAAIATAGIPVPTLVLAAAATIQLGGGVLLIAGYRTQTVAALLAALSISAAFMFHHVRGDLNQQIHFLKNLAIAGGLLQLAAFGAGGVSVDSNISEESAKDRSAGNAAVSGHANRCG